MKRKFKLVLLLSAALFLVTFLNACSEDKSEGTESNKEAESAGSGQADLAEDQVLHLTATSDFTSLDPHHASDAPSFDSLYQIRSGLVTLDENGEIVPDMAKAMPEISKDGTVYTFTLKDDVVWSNGDPVTAQDFVYSWQREVNPETAGEYAFIYLSANIENAANIRNKKSAMYGDTKKIGIEAINQRKLKITLEKPTPYFLDLLTFPPFYPLNEEFVKKQGADFALEPENMLFNGPFKLDKWNHGVGWTYTKNDKYWNADKVTLEKVKYKVVKQKNTAVNIYKSGSLDFLKLSSDYIQLFQDSEELHTGELTAEIKFIRLNQQHEALANEHIRDAIYNSINRKGLVDVLVKTGAEPARYVVPKSFAKGPDGKDFRAKYPSINKMSLEEARQSWMKGLKEIGKEKVEIGLMIGDTDTNATIAEYYANQLEENLPGLTVTINRQPYQAHLKLEGNRKYDMSKWGWLPDYRDPITFLDLWATDEPFNRTGYSNPEYDALIKKAKNLGNQPKKRWKIMQKAEKILLEDAVIVPTHQAATAYVKKPYVKHVIVRNYGPTVDWTYARVLKH
ncbi:peptide ABC transporter substrate-binding protein [Virgibacillus siamensis]|uniref:peptide ABC transporter substrate-binding protein n=1 Tax=Virgibacillus siamensis TaxID=480071 RepID=UPI0009856E8C|nr:peptide ABC transporter substrate-binding protein [Virgibacillus siamensis]